MPRLAARWFIQSTKVSTSPAQWRATARAASLPDWSSRPYSKVFRGSFSPAFRYMEEPSASVSAGWIVTAASRSGVDSSATRAVISLVMLAMSRFSWAFFS